MQTLAENISVNTYPTSNFYGAFATIYALIDKDGKWFYIGCTFNPERRLKEHIKEARERYELFLTNKIRTIRASNYEIVIKTLEIVWTTGVDHYNALKIARKTETLWIRKLIKEGFILTNKLGRISKNNETDRQERFNAEYKFWKENYQIQI